MIPPSNRTRTRGALSVVAAILLSSPGLAQSHTPPEAKRPTRPACEIDLTKPGMMKDIVWNALRREFMAPNAKVETFLRGAESRFRTGRDLMRAAASAFELKEAALADAVEKYRHCNCEHCPDPARLRSSKSEAPSTATLSRFATDVLMHVVLHELAHALVREFDLPILGNEETLADAFATFYLTTYLPDRAPAVLLARTTSLMIEAQEVARDRWTVRGEHNNDARRAYQIAALAVAADADRYRAVAARVGMTPRDIKKARDYGAEIHRSWRRILRPLWMPEGTASTEARVKRDQSPLLDQIERSGLTNELAAILKRFDWHSQVKIHFKNGGGTAGWSRSQRTIKVYSGYIERFIRQGDLNKTRRAKTK